MLASKFEQDLYDFDPKAKLMAPSTRRVQMQRSKVLQIAGLQCMRERGIKAMPPNLIPSMDQTITMMLNHPANDPYNKPTGRFSKPTTVFISLESGDLKTCARHKNHFTSGNRSPQ